MNSIKEEKIECIGCTVCQTVCPTSAIKMEENAYGFFEPQLDKQKCISCGKCVKFCPSLNLSPKRKPLEQYASWNKNDSERYLSTSGGMFVGLAHCVQQENGIIFGAVYNDDFFGVHHASTEEKDITQMQGSKYVVSDLRNSFEQVVECAKKGKKVLFVGTPCQCAGLHMLTKDYDNVILCDFICGGTPTTKAFREYMQLKQKKQGHPLVDISFRGKDTGWKKQYLSLTYANGKKERTFYLYDPYFSLFCMKHISTRSACNRCSFRQRHMADITIADFWGYRSTQISDDDKGISLVAINTRKGKDLWEKFENKTCFPLSEQQIAYAYQEFPVDEKREQIKEKFMEELKEKNFNEISREFVKVGKVHVFFTRIRSRLGW